MKFCEQCQLDYPDQARYCMQCGRELAPAPEKRQSGERHAAGDWRVFWLTLGGSLALSWLLIAVFHLPVFIIGAFLPLLWYSRK